jgi:hypothetical protein
VLLFLLLELVLLFGADNFAFEKILVSSQTRLGFSSKFCFLASCCGKCCSSCCFSAFSGDRFCKFPSSFCFNASANGLFASSLCGNRGLSGCPVITLGPASNLAGGFVFGAEMAYLVTNVFVGGLCACVNVLAPGEGFCTDV